MIARLTAYDPYGTTELGVLPTTGLTFSVEVGGGGGCTFEAQADDMDTLNAWDSVVALEFETTPGVWTEVQRYALRPPYRRQRVGKQPVQCRGTSLLEAWAGETVLFPEFATTRIPRGAGTERAIGWQSGTYNPATDPAEDWSKVTQSPRTVFPQDWPTESGAEWISVAGATEDAERKLFRSPFFTIPAGPAELVKVYFSSDESADLYVAGEPIISTSSVETGYEYFSVAYMVLRAGTYSVAVSTFHDISKGGDGTDPVAVAIATLNDNLSTKSWLSVSQAPQWFACRRDDEPPDNEPPGPTPGDVVATLQDEAANRGASGWANVSRDFTAAADSYGQPWGSAVVVERMHRIAMDDMWTVWSAFGETAECDVWMEGMTLRCAPAQGTTPGVALTTATVPTMNDTVPQTQGSWCVGYAIDGWHQSSTGTMRREYGVELGTAISRPVADRIIAESLSDDGRWDGGITLAPSAPVPLVAFGAGDTLTLTYPDAPSSVRVLSIGGRARDGGIEFDLEVTT